MGGDGGSIPSRADMVKTKGYKFLRNLGGMGYTPNTQIKAANEHFGRNEEIDIRISTCAISQEPLRKPVFACKLGRLYNKEEVLAKMLEKMLPPHMEHIKSLKDMKEVNAEIDSKTHFFICPITRTEIKSGSRGCINWKCGCILSQKAILASGGKNSTYEKMSLNLEDSAKKEIKRSECLNCGKPFNAEQDLIPLIPTEEEEENLLQKIQKQNKAGKNAKKNNKIKRSSDKSVILAARDKESIEVGTNGTNKAIHCEKRDGASNELERVQKACKRERDWILSGVDVSNLFENGEYCAHKKIKVHEIE